MKWERAKMQNGDTVWKFGRYQVAVTGEDSGGRPVQWGLWRGEEQITGKYNKYLGRAPHLSWDTVRAAKAKAEALARLEAEDAPMSEANELRAELERLQTGLQRVEELLTSGAELATARGTVREAKYLRAAVRFVHSVRFPKRRA